MTLWLVIKKGGVIDLHGFVMKDSGGRCEEHTAVLGASEV